MMFIASIVTIAAVALAYQITLPQIWTRIPARRRRHRGLPTCAVPTP